MVVGVHLAAFGWFFPSFHIYSIPSCLEFFFLVPLHAEIMHIRPHQIDHKSQDQSSKQAAIHGTYEVPNPCGRILDDI